YNYDYAAFSQNAKTLHQFIRNLPLSCGQDHQRRVSLPDAKSPNTQASFPGAHTPHPGRLTISPASGDPLSTTKPGLHAGLLSARKHLSRASISPPEPTGAGAAAYHPTAVAGRPAGRPGSVQQPVLIMGDSTIRHVQVSRFHQLSVKHSSAETFILHAGTNNLKLQQSETLKMDFIHLIHTIQQLNINCIISGPLTAPRHGDIMFSRIRQLHIWLKTCCYSMNIPYIDNFTTFSNRPYLFKSDGSHPNNSGSRLLRMNIDLTLRSFKTIPR
uniref:SGNH hydrolase-type esterase domain-containing protein n=1 Tax=Oryzias latipes TaxID=8090 RepID=A0A3P9HPI9_ORYLA